GRSPAPRPSPRPAPGPQSRAIPMLPSLLPAVASLALLAACVPAIFMTHPLGHDGLVAAAIAALLVWLLLTARRKPAPAGPPEPRGRLWLRRTRGLARWLFVVLLAGWLGPLGLA